MASAQPHMPDTHRKYFNFSEKSTRPWTYNVQLRGNCNRRSVIFRLHFCWLEFLWNRTHGDDRARESAN